MNEVSRVNYRKNLVNELPRQKLRELVTIHGRSLCEDSQRCEDLLQNVYSRHRWELFLLLCALKERVPAELLASQEDVPREELLMKLTQRLQDKHVLTENAARWAVESWALALGIISNAEAYQSVRTKSSFRSVLLKITGALFATCVVLGVAYVMLFPRIFQPLSPPVPPPNAAPPSPVPSPTELYQTALGHYIRGDYTLAISGFQSYLALSPEQKLTSAAHYWLGESYYNLGNYRQAIQEFDLLVTAGVESPHIPTALLKQALAYAELREFDQARRGLQHLTSLFPHSTEAKQARNQLEMPLLREERRDLQRRIEEVVTRKGFKDLAVEVKDNGIALISGTLADKNDLATVARLVANVPGVHEVQTHSIAVLPPEPDPQEVRERVEEALQAKGLHDVQVQIDAERYITLTGRVRDDQEEIALSIARSQQGVENVTSRLTKFRFIVTVQKDVEAISVRTEPSLAANVLGTIDLQQGDKIHVIETDGVWYKIWIPLETGDRRGWIHKSLIAQPEPEAPKPKPHELVLKQVREALQAKGLHDVQVQIDARYHITLTGRVQNNQEEEIALSIARAQRGVKNVTNRLVNRTKLTVNSILGGSFE